MNAISKNTEKLIVISILSSLNTEMWEQTVSNIILAHNLKDKEIHDIVHKVCQEANPKRYKEGSAGRALNRPNSAWLLKYKNDFIPYISVDPSSESTSTTTESIFNETLTESTIIPVPKTLSNSERMQDIRTRVTCKKMELTMLELIAALEAKLSSKDDGNQTVILTDEMLNKLDGIFDDIIDVISK